MVSLLDPLALLSVVLWGEGLLLGYPKDSFNLWDRFKKSSNSFSSEFQVILAMPRHQQEQLTASVMDAFKRDFSGKRTRLFILLLLLSADPAALVRMAMTDNAMQGMILTCVVSYLRWTSDCFKDLTLSFSTEDRDCR